MDFYTAPVDLKNEFLLQLFDDALADIAEGSDIVGEDPHFNSHVCLSLEQEYPVYFFPETFLGMRDSQGTFV